MTARFIVVIVGLTTPVVMPAQRTPRVIAPTSVSLPRSAAGTDSMRIVLVRDGMERSGGLLITTLASARLAGQTSYLAIAHDVSPEGHRTYDTLAVDAATLAPLWHRTHAPRDSAAVRYDGRKVSGYIAYEGRGETAVAATLTEHAFDAAIVPWVVASLPFRPGDTARVVSFAMWGGAEETTTLRVAGVDSLALRDGGVAPVWVIETTSGPRDRALHRLWIDQRTRRVLRTFDAPPRAAREGDGYWKVSTLLRP